MIAIPVPDLLVHVLSGGLTILNYHENDCLVDGIGGSSWYDVSLLGCCVGFVGRLFWRYDSERWWLSGFDLGGYFLVSSFPCNEKVSLVLSTRKESNYENKGEHESRSDMFSDYPFKNKIRILKRIIKIFWRLSNIIGIVFKRNSFHRLFRFEINQYM